MPPLLIDWRINQYTICSADQGHQLCYSIVVKGAEKGIYVD